MSAEFPTIAEAAALIAAKKLSPVELAEACLARVAAHDATLHAFVTVTEERARADARIAEAEIMAGKYKGPLHGIPIGHKDIIDTRGIPTTSNSAQTADRVPNADATVAAALDAAGTVLVGKLTTHEFADGGPSFDLPWPPARNPWKPSHFTAGSSSGTGAAVAAGLVLGGTGTDTGGSIRGPAALCGIVGLKPTYGLVSRAGVAPAAWSLDHIGPMCWTVEDCALMLQAMAGHDPADPASAARAVPDYRAQMSKGARGLRVGLVRRWHETDHVVAPAVQAAIDAAVKVYESEGAEVVEVALPPLQEFAACGFVISAVERGAAYEDMMWTAPEKFGQRYRDRLFFAAFVTGNDYVQATRRRRELTAEILAALDGVDVLLTAGNQNEAPPIDRVPRWDNLEKPNFTMTFNLTGLPALCVPAGFGPQGLPIAIQLAARPFDEATLFRAAHVYESATAWRDVRPAMVVAARAAAE